MATAKMKSYQGQLSMPFELGENMSIGDPFYVYDDAGTPKIAKCTKNTANKSTYAKGYYNVACMIGTDKFVVYYSDMNNSNRSTARVGQFDVNGIITWGTAVVVATYSSYYLDVCSHGTDAFCCIYRGNGNTAEVRVCTVATGTLTITLGATVSTVSMSTAYYQQITSPAAGKVCAVYKDAGSSNYLRARAATIVGTVATFGIAVTLDTNNSNYMSVCSPAADKIATTYYASSKGYAIAATLSGTTITSGTRSEYNSVAVYTNYVKAPDTNKIMNLFRNAADGYKLYARCATLSGTTFTWGTVVKIIDSSSYYHAFGVAATDEVGILAAWDTSPYKGVFIKATISGTTITLKPSDTLANGRVYYVDCLGISTDKYALFWYETTELLSYAFVTTGEINTVPRCLGILEESGLNGDTKKGAMLGGVTKAFTGLDIGAVYYIQDNGTITNVTSSNAIAVAYKDDEGFITKTFQG